MLYPPAISSIAMGNPPRHGGVFFGENPSLNLGDVNAMELISGGNVPFRLQISCGFMLFFAGFRLDVGT